MPQEQTEQQIYGGWANCQYGDLVNCHGAFGQVPIAIRPDPGGQSVHIKVYRCGSGPVRGMDLHTGRKVRIWRRPPGPCMTSLASGRFGHGGRSASAGAHDVTSVQVVSIPSDRDLQSRVSGREIGRRAITHLETRRVIRRLTRNWAASLFAKLERG